MLVSQRQLARIRTKINKISIINKRFLSFVRKDNATETNNEPHVNFHNLAMSATLEINERQRELQRQGREVYKFGFGESPMPVPICMVDKLKEYAHKKEYLPVRGLLELRESIATYYNKRFIEYNYNILPENIMITPGTKQSLFLIQFALRQNCEILLPSPSWVSYYPQAQIMSKGVNIKWVQTELDTNWKIDPNMFEDTYLKPEPNKQRLLILNSPSNPTGALYTNNELKALSDVCRKYNIIVLSDEIYGELYHDINNGSYTSMHQYYPEGTIISNGISKHLGSGGWRMGFSIYPPELKWLTDAVYVGCSETHTSVSAPIQYGAIEAYSKYDSDEIQTYLNISRKVLSSLGSRFTNLLNDIPGCQAIKPDGGFYVFPDFSNVKNIDKMINKWSKNTNKSSNEWSSKEFALFLLNECGVAGLYSTPFGRPKDELTMRLAFVDFDGSDIYNTLTSNDKWNFENIDAASNEMDEFLTNFCPRTMTGMNVLNDYLASL